MIEPLAPVSLSPSFLACVVVSHTFLQVHRISSVMPVLYLLVSSNYAVGPAGYSDL